MARWLAVVVVSSILGAPALACLAMRQSLQHECCHKKPQPQPKCCLLNPSHQAEPVAAVDLSITRPAAYVAAFLDPVLRAEAAAPSTSLSPIHDIAIENRPLRL